MNILIDTNALFWYLENSSSLSKHAESSIDEASQVFIPTIVLLELIYLLKKKRRFEEFPIILDKMIDKRYKILSLDLAIVFTAHSLSSKLEMHDNVIVSTARLLSLPIVTKDRTIRKIYKNTIW